MADVGGVVENIPHPRSTSWRLYSSGKGRYVTNTKNGSFVQVVKRAL